MYGKTKNGIIIWSYIRNTSLSFVNNLSDINLFLSLLNCVYMCQREEKKEVGEEGGAEKKK